MSRTTGNQADNIADPVLASEVVEVENIYRVLPAEVPSREEQLRQLDPPPPLPVRATIVRPRFQFSVLDLMVLMVGVAAGLAGGTWMPADIFAACLGLVTLGGLFLVHLYPPESHTGNLIWGTLVLSYIIAVLAALV